MNNLYFYCFKFKSNSPGDPDLTEKELDVMIMDYKRHTTEFMDDFEVLGWPRCSYTVSKVAVNAYTRILQKQLDEAGNGWLLPSFLYLSFVYVNVPLYYLLFPRQV